MVGKKLSDFEATELFGDIKISNKDLKKNNFTLINFWASWCAPCKKEHKYLILLRDKAKLKILGINFKDKENNAKNFLNDLGNPYYFLAKDDNGKVSVDFGIYGVPESILIDKDLTIIKKIVGPISAENYKEIIEIISNS